MREKIIIDLKNAMKNQNKELLNVIRMVKGAMQLEEINLKRELTDAEITSVISKQIKTRKETMEDLKKAGRDETIKQTEKEIAILNKYMPTLMGEAEIIKVIDGVFKEVNPTSTDTGKVMAKLAVLKGQADMALVNKIVKERLSNL
ncbi:MAG: GatB/YqeY domain-containing protein [Bacilli bacterium]